MHYSFRFVEKLQTTDPWQLCPNTDLKVGHQALPRTLRVDFSRRLAVDWTTLSVRSSVKYSLLKRGSTLRLFSRLLRYRRQRWSNCLNENCLTRFCGKAAHCAQWISIGNKKIQLQLKWCEILRHQVADYILIKNLEELSYYNTVNGNMKKKALPHSEAAQRKSGK